jgi:serine protease Do
MKGTIEMKNGFTRKAAAAMLICCVLSGAAGSGLTLLAADGFAPGAFASKNIVAPAYWDTALLAADVQGTATQARLLSIADIFNAVGPSVVSITAKAAVTDRFGRSETAEGFGSGIIIAESGYILTNNHVAEGATTLSVALSTGAEYAARLVGKDSRTDLAVLKIEAAGLPFAKLGDSSALKAGDLAVAIGNPLGELSGTVTAGIVSATDREITIEGERMNLLQTDAAINPGNSGGALCNIYGEVIGVVSAKTSALGIEGLGFAIPINDAKPVVEQLIAKGYVSGRAEMGVAFQEVTEQTARFFRVSAGVYVNGVIAGGPAAAAGILRGDRIVSVGGEAVLSAAGLKAIIEKHSVGDRLTVVVDRNGTTRSLSVTLREAVG